MRKISVLLIIAILAAMLITGCNKASAPAPSTAPEVSESAGAPVSEPATNDMPAVDAPEAENQPAVSEQPSVTEPEQGGEGASSPSMAPAEQENTTDDGLCGYPLAEPVTTAFEMYMQHYFENGSIIEIPQILDDSPTAEDINRELREIGDEYYREYSDYIGTRRCEVIAYPCETEDYLCIVLVERELPEDNDSDGEVESWVYDKKTKMQLVVDVTIDPETIKAAMTPGMVFEEIEDIEYRYAPNGHDEYYITVEYSIDGEEYDGLFVLSGNRVTKYTEGSLVPSYAVANFAEPLWARWEENHNGLYDTSASDEKIAEVGEKLKELAVIENDLVLRPEDLEAEFLYTGDFNGNKGEHLIYYIYTEKGTFASYGLFAYDIEADSYCAQ